MCEGARRPFGWATGVSPGMFAVLMVGSMLSWFACSLGYARMRWRRRDLGLPFIGFLNRLAYTPASARDFLRTDPISVFLNRTRGCMMLIGLFHWSLMWLVVLATR